MRRGAPSQVDLLEVAVSDIAGIVDTTLPTPTVRGGIDARQLAEPMLTSFSIVAAGEDLLLWLAVTKPVSRLGSNGHHPVGEILLNVAAHIHGDRLLSGWTVWPYSQQVATAATT